MTHNILNEQSIQQNLQKFNYEVFVSKTMFDMLLHEEDPWNISFYQLIILSESLSNKELEVIVPKLKERRAVIFRKYVCEPLNKEKDAAKALEIDRWISREIGIDTLRELISECAVMSTAEPSDYLSKETFEGLIMDFTKNQKKYFLTLYEADSSLVSRKELCQSIWGVESTRSNLAQLSVLTKALRQKLMNKGFPSDTIETVWGKGYHLNKKFYHMYPKSQQS
ncbi:winged helix-turn-helix domain-containing protein [Enterococcus raffinosus]|uniref:winged helix-turn-helix domain-containing protein n=1 Tax=Enterococcus raffinosus TaxID=71452 RepID=UPI00091D3918|nr:winged helix-turn-helix domain-containing protein [Enterococcus raffinosus]OJG85784.1 hypothetical protein RV13_GL000855 [Enterococcus raffinosus]GMS53014.1 helix-turn-helix domain-containing protein [Enterococcus raffinosus]